MLSNFLQKQEGKIVSVGKRGSLGVVFRFLKGEGRGGGREQVGNHEGT